MKKVIVIGASRGIGKELSLRLANENVHTIATLRNLEAAVDELKTNSNVHLQALDIKDETSVRQFFSNLEDFNEVVALVFVAGVGSFGDFVDLDTEAYDHMFDTNVKGLYLVVREFLKAMPSLGCRFICISSDVSARGIAKGALYSSTKHAQRAMLRSLQMEYRDRIQFTEIRPGNVATNFAGNEGLEIGDLNLSPEDVVDAILYVLYQAARVRVDEIAIRPNSRDIEY